MEKITANVIKILESLNLGRYVEIFVVSYLSYKKAHNDVMIAACQEVLKSVDKVKQVRNRINSSNDARKLLRKEYSRK